MKKKIQSIISCILALVMVVMVFANVTPVNAATTSQTKEEVLFEDDFSSYTYTGTNAATYKNNAMKARGWDSSYLNNTRAGYASDGVYTVPSEQELQLFVLGNTEALTWCEYTVEADIKIPAMSEISNDQRFYIVLNAAERTGSGYEFGIVCTTEGEVNFNLRRSGGTSYKTVALNDFSVENVYSLKLTYVNGILYGYCGEQLIVSYDTSSDDVRLTKGTAGFRKYGKELSVVYDNFRVVSEKKNVILKEDFSYDDLSAFKKAGWHYTATSGIELADGKLAIDGSVHNTITTNSVEGVAAWNDYTVEADITITPGAVAQGRVGVGILGRTGLDGNNGYELCLFVNTAGKVTAWVRVLGSTNTKLTSSDVAIGDLSGTSEPQTYHLKANFYGNQISFYVGDTLVYSGTETTYTSGAAGVKILKADEVATENALSVAVDDFKVTALEENVVETLADVMSDNITVSKNNVLTKTTFSETEDDADEYSVEVDVTIDPNNKPSSDTPSAGIICRYHKDGNNKDCYYIFEVTMDKNGKVMARKRIMSAGSTVTAQTENTQTLDNALTSKTTYHLKVTTSSSSINYYVNGALKYTITLEGHDYRFTSGQTGTIVRTTEYVTVSPFSFQNFKVVSLTTASELLGDVDNDAIISNADFNNLNEQLWAGTSDNTDVNEDEATNAADLVRLVKIMEYYDL